jgi:hypothetical protein
MDQAPETAGHAAAAFIENGKEWGFQEFCRNLGLPTDKKTREAYMHLSGLAEALESLKPPHLEALFTREEE